MRYAFGVLSSLLLASSQSSATPLSLPHAIPLSEEQALPLTHQLVRRANTNYDVNTYVSLGDSFSAGPAAGDEITPDDGNCRRFTKALGPDVNADSRIHGNRVSADDFNQKYFLACTADKIGEARSQIAKVPSNTEMVTLTIGGNDVYFGGIVNGCIYLIKPTTWECQTWMDEARKKMNTDGFKSDLVNYYNDVFKQAKKTHLYVIGYPTFFNEIDHGCDDTCFQFGVPTSSCRDGGRLLTTDFRKKMNDLVRDLNTVIEEQVDKATVPSGASIQYVSSDEKFENHRFCEKGVQEPDYDNPNIWFYPFTWWRRNWLTSMSKQKLSDMNCPAISPQGEYGERFDCDLVANLTSDKTWFNNLLDNKNIPWDNTPAPAATRQFEWAIRIFHPTQGGFNSMKDGVYDAYHEGPGVNSANPSSSSTSKPATQTSTTSKGNPTATTVANANTQLQVFYSFKTQSDGSYKGNMLAYDGMKPGENLKEPCNTKESASTAANMNAQGAFTGLPIVVKGFASNAPGGPYWENCVFTYKSQTDMTLKCDGMSSTVKCQNNSGLDVSTKCTSGANADTYWTSIATCEWGGQPSS